MNNYGLRRFIHKNPILTNSPSLSTISSINANNRIHSHLRCTIFDEHGNIETFNSLIEKDELCKRYNLFPRDLRKLNTVTDYMGQLVVDKDKKIESNAIQSLQKANKNNSTHIKNNDFKKFELKINNLNVDPNESGVDILLEAVRKRKSMKREEINKNQIKTTSKSLLPQVFEKKSLSLTTSFLDNQTLTLNNLVSFDSAQKNADFKKGEAAIEKKKQEEATAKEEEKQESSIKNFLKNSDSEIDIQQQQEKALKILTNIKDSFITGGVLDSNTSATIPSLLIRDDKILVTMLEFRCMIEKDSVVVFDSHYFREIRKYTSLLENMLRTEDYILNHNADDNSLVLLTRSEIRRNLNKLNYLYSLHNEFRNEMSIKLKDSNMFINHKQPFEFRALEAVLNMVIKALNGELKYHVNKANRVLTDLEYNIDKVTLKELLLIDKRFNKFHQKAKLCCTLLEEILDDEKNISDMYLHISPKDRMHLTDNKMIDLEMLLENYHTQLAEIVQMCERNMNSIKTTEEIINIILDSNRNQLMLLGLRFSTVLLSLGAGIFIASVYGMNLENFIEHHEDGFGLVVFIGSIIIFLVLAASLKKVVEVEKMNLTKLMKPTGNIKQKGKSEE